MNLKSVYSRMSDSSEDLLLHLEGVQAPLVDDLTLLHLPQGINILSFFEHSLPHQTEPVLSHWKFEDEALLAETWT